MNFEVAEAAIEVLKRHLWYLRPGVVVFSLFVELVSLDEKAKISKRLPATPRHYDGHYSPSAVVLDDTTTLADLIDKGSRGSRSSSPPAVTPVTGVALRVRQ